MHVNAKNVFAAADKTHAQYIIEIKLLIKSG